MSTIPNPAKSRTWDLGTSANGTFFDTEFNQLYANDNDLNTRAQALESAVSSLQSAVAGVRVAHAAVTMSGSTITIRSSSGIISIVRDLAGNFTVTMATARSNIYYQVAGLASANYGAVYFGNLQINSASGVEVAPTTTVFKFEVLPLTGPAYDPKYCYFSVYDNP